LYYTWGMEAQELTSTKQVFEVLGGIAGVAKLTNSNYSTAGNWSSTNKFPARTYITLQRELAERGFSARPELWGMS